MSDTVATPTLSLRETAYTLAWEKLPDDYELPDEPVENTDHPLLAAALREALEVDGFVRPEMLIATNFGLCANINGQTVVKAPDWLYVKQTQTTKTVLRSYTPYLEGDIPLLVMEFLSGSGQDEYSVKPTPPYGKFFFYEQVLKIPYYAIFDPVPGTLEMYILHNNRYQLLPPDHDGRYLIAPMQLSVGVWHGTKSNRTGNWLRWWHQDGTLLPWSLEHIRSLEAALQQQHDALQQERQAREAAEHRMQVSEKL